MSGQKDLDEYDFASLGGMPGALMPGTPRVERAMLAQADSRRTGARIANLISATLNPPTALPVAAPDRPANPLGTATPFTRTTVALPWTPTSADMSPWPDRSRLFSGASEKSFGRASTPEPPLSRGQRNAIALGGHPTLPGDLSLTDPSTRSARSSMSAPARATAPDGVTSADIPMPIIGAAPATPAPGLDLRPASFEAAVSPFEAAVSPFSATRAERRGRSNNARESTFGKHGAKSLSRPPQAVPPAPLTDHMHTISAKGRKTGAAANH